MSEQQQYRPGPDKFDRIMGSLVNAGDVTNTKASTVTVVSPLIGEAQTFVVQTYRQREIGDTIFIQYAASEGLLRVAVPPAVADLIARQRDALTTRVRRTTAKRIAAERKAAGILPGFMKGKGRRSAKGGAA